MTRTLLMVLAIATFGCDSPREEAREEAEEAREEAREAAEEAREEAREASDEDYEAWDNTSAAADNTDRNDRDRDMDTLTPEDQGGDEDMTITQRVRQGVVEEYGATASAANVTIVTVDGVVTLRGPVDSETEQAAIERIARGVAGVQRVDNQLEIESK